MMMTNAFDALAQAFSQALTDALTPLHARLAALEVLWEDQRDYQRKLREDMDKVLGGAAEYVTYGAAQLREDVADLREQVSSLRTNFDESVLQVLRDEFPDLPMHSSRAFANAVTSVLEDIDLNQFINMDDLLEDADLTKQVRDCLLDALQEQGTLSIQFV